MNTKRILYTFSLPKPEMVDETTTSLDDKGNEVKTTVKVKKDVEHKFHIVKPIREQYEEVELFYGAKMAEGTRRGLLLRAVLEKQYSNDGGMFSEKEKKYRAELVTKLISFREDYEKLGVEPDNKEKKDVILKEMVEIQEELRNFEMFQQRLFDNTAESWAESKALMWWMFTLSHIEKNGDIEPMFQGQTYEEKLKSLDKYEDGDWDFYKKVIERFQFLVTFWTRHKEAKPEDFDEVLKLISGEQKT